MLDINEELPARGGKRSDTDILAGIRGEIVDDEELDDALEVKDELPVPATSLEVEKHLEVLQQLILLCWEGNEMKKVIENGMRKGRLCMKLIKQKDITLNSLESWTWSEILSVENNKGYVTK